MSNSRIEDPLGLFEGWGGVEPGVGKENAEILESAELERINIDQQFLNIFTTREGEKVLAHLKKMTLDNETWCASLGLEKGAAHGYAREGQNSVIRYILERMEAAKAANDKTKGAK